MIQKLIENLVICPWCLHLQAIQDITRNKDIDPEEIVSLIFERIDVKGEGNKDSWAQLR